MNIVAGKVYPGVVAHLIDFFALGVEVSDFDQGIADSYVIVLDRKSVV